MLFRSAADLLLALGRERHGQHAAGDLRRRFIGKDRAVGANRLAQLLQQRLRERDVDSRVKVTEQDIDHVITQMRSAVEKLRALSPLWDMYKEGVDLNSVEWNEH